MKNFLKFFYIALRLSCRRSAFKVLELHYPKGYKISKPVAFNLTCDSFEIIVHLQKK